MIEVVIACRRHRVLVCTGVHIQVELVNWEDYVLWLICTAFIYILQSVRLKGQCSHARAMGEGMGGYWREWGGVSCSVYDRWQWTIEMIVNWYKYLAIHAINALNLSLSLSVRALHINYVFMNISLSLFESQPYSTTINESETI